MTRYRDVICILAGVAGLVLVSRYAGPGEILVHSYAGNVSVSFAVYFLAKRVTTGSRWPVLLAVALALGAVELFELTDGFGIMSNTYDPFDLLANVIGIGVGVGLDRLLPGRERGRVEHAKEPPR